MISKYPKYLILNGISDQLHKYTHHFNTNKKFYQGLFCFFFVQLNFELRFNQRKKLLIFLIKNQKFLENHNEFGKKYTVFWEKYPTTVPFQTQHKCPNSENLKFS